MRKNFLLYFLTLVLCSCAAHTSPKPHNELKTTEDTSRGFDKIEFQKLRAHAMELKMQYHGQYSPSVCFLVDMKIPNGRKRFFVYDFKKDTVIAAGLVAHGNCNSILYLEEARFANQPGCGCSSGGKYKIGYGYTGNFGKAYKLFGLESTNSNAFDRSIVLHAHNCIPNEEIYPNHICNSLGCPTVSPLFLTTLTELISKSEKPVLLWVLK